jgi:hypothetical protein
VAFGSYSAALELSESGDLFSECEEKPDAFSECLIKILTMATKKTLLLKVSQ